MLKHAERTRKLRGIPRPNFRRTRFLSQSWPARINEIRCGEAAPSHGKRSCPTPAGMKRESGVSLEFEDTFPSRTSTSQMELNVRSKRLSCVSDTSSAYSGSDTMASSQSLLDGDDLDLSDLVESSVDSDCEDFTRSVESLSFQDTLKESLEKDPAERTEKDIELLLDLTKQLEAFAKMTSAVQLAICKVMVFAVVEIAGTELMHDGDEMDSWCVIINGSVEVEHPSGRVEQLRVGDCFGIQLSLEKERHSGEMRTLCDDCQFVCVSEADYYSILRQGEENIRRYEEGGRVVLVTETQGERQVVIQGTPERLIKQLVEDKPAYIEDFLLTYRTFIDDPLRITDQLQQWFSEPAIRDRVAVVALLWVKNHFNDFETNPEMMSFLERFVGWLEQQKMQGELNMLSTLLEASSRTRNIVLTRSSRDETLPFNIKGGSENGFGVFVSQVDKHSKAEAAGLLRGDQILSVNGQNFEASPVSHEKALKTLRDSTHLSITVKSNMIVFRELVQTADVTSRRRCGRTSVTTLAPGAAAAAAAAAPEHAASLPARASRHNKENKAGGGGSGGGVTAAARNRLQRVLTQFGQPIFNFLVDNSVINSSIMESSLCPKLFIGNITAALPPNQNMEALRNAYTMYGLKVYRPDQTFKYVLAHQDTTAEETVQLALHEFGVVTQPAADFFLCEVSVAEGGLVKQSRLPDHMSNLAGRIALNSRYYLKAYGSTEPLVPDELVPELIKESKTHFLQLNCAQVAIQLTLQDFSVFKQIENTEYVDKIFKLKSRYGTQMLTQFSELVNREMFWVITEVCSELNVVRRSKIIKQFIKLARECKVCNNFNSMFAILSGLGYRSVTRLKLSWDRLPAKYQKMFTDLEEFMDTSRNMSKYRQYVMSKISKSPIIPFYPLVNKDLTFIFEGNEMYLDGLINFENLRKFAQVVRSLNSMCSCPYDLLTLLEKGGQSSSTAMKSLNLNLTSVVGQPNEDGTIHNRRKNSPVTLNAKKMFEEAQMVRRVKEYLNNMRVITDEEKLYVMSLMCEPPLRKRQPSPASSSGNSSAGSTSSPAGAKSGGETSLSARKLLSRSEPIKTPTLQARGGAATPAPAAAPRRPGSCAPAQGRPRRVSCALASPTSAHQPSAAAADRPKLSLAGTVLQYVSRW